MTYFMPMYIPSSGTGSLSNWAPNTMLFVISMLCVVIALVVFIIGLWLDDDERSMKIFLTLMLSAIILCVLSLIFGHTVE